MTIRRDGDDLVIEGTVKPAESAAQAGWLLVTGRSEGGMTQVLIPADASGVKIKPLKAIDVTRRFAAVSFDGVRVPPRRWWATMPRPMPQSGGKSSSPR